MRTEIGGEFWNIPTTTKNNLIFDKATWFVSGRAAFRSILRQISIENAGLKTLKVALPSYLCESMLEPLVQENIEFKFYSVSFKDGFFQYDYSNVFDCNVILIIDYFGYESLINDYPRSGKIIIRDLTHSVFTKKYNDADYYFGSLRKWAGFIGAGFAWKKKGKPFAPTSSLDSFISLRKIAIEAKHNYIIEKVDDKSYLKTFYEAERLLDNCDIAISGSDDVDKAKYLDVEYIKTARRNNAALLINELGNICLIKSLNKNDCPLVVPIVCDKRDELRQYLIDRNIYCPVHWPKPFKEKSESDALYMTELSLVCDQRYSTNDMKRIVSVIREFMENYKNA